MGCLVYVAGVSGGHPVRQSIGFSFHGPWFVMNESYVSATNQKATYNAYALNPTPNTL